MLRKFRSAAVLLLILGFSSTLMGTERANDYFPNTVSSYWTYQDQDGNELTRYAVEPEEIDGETYHAFSHEPPLKNWADFEHYVQPYAYRVDDEGVTFFVGTETENAFKAVKIQQIEKRISLTRETIEQDAAANGLNISVETDYDVEVESQDYFHLLPTSTSLNEEWTALALNVTVSMTTEFKGMPEVPGVPTKFIVDTYTTLVETGYITGTETVETPAGTFEDCLVIEYRADASIKTVPPQIAGLEADTEPVHQEQKDVSLTTLWLAPHVGIVKFVHNHQLSEEEQENGLEPPSERTLELTRYEIQPSASE